jgi:AraC family carnitine catabolism transcriptional activator
MAMLDPNPTLKRSICFLLMPEFPLYALVPAIEALRLANQNSGSVLYEWSFASTDGGRVSAGNGFSLEHTQQISRDFSPEFVIVCAGNQPTDFLDRKLLDWLSRRAAFGAQLGAIDTGAFALAAAGVITGYQLTLHWEARGAFLEMFPNAEVLDQIYVIDRDRWTCAGGSAALDMMLEMIEMDAGRPLAEVVTDGFVHGHRRAAVTPQREHIGVGTSMDSSVWVRIQRIMNATFRTPLSIDELCRKVGTSRRTLERAFTQNSGTSPATYYLQLRLAAGKDMLLYTNYPISRIAETIGFSSHTDFTRAFKRHYHHAPNEFRKKNSADMRHKLHPQGQALVGLAQLGE